MSDVFLKLLNLSITASWLILAVILVRLLLKKAPKWISCVLWALVAIRLVCPFSLESALSLIPSSETIPSNIEMMQKPAIDSGITVINETINPVISNSFTPDPLTSANPLQIIVPVLSIVWIAGIAAMLLYALISYIRLKKSVGASVPVRDNIWACDEVKSPFILGIIKPLIYVPSSMTEPTLDYVITHETAHIKRHDHWWKPFGYLLLAMYWFNPLCWLAYVLLCRDIEMACDEKVIRDMDKGSIAAYSQALLNCSFPRKKIAACPLAFGEVGVKKRVKSVLNYKKPAFWMIVVAVVVCIVVTVCFLTNPKTKFTVSEASIEKVTVFHAETDDGMSRELSLAQISEMVGRFSGIKHAKRSEKYAGFAPGYQLCVLMKDGSSIYANGYRFDDYGMVDVVYDGKRYAIADDDFAKYLINICAGKDVAASQMVGNATKWFDYLHGDEMLWDGMREINLDEFPGVTFRAYSERIEAVTDKEVIPLYTGMPIWSVYFCDLTGDGKPELCSTLSFGSGTADNRFIIYNYARGESYEMSDRGKYDYTLNMHNGKLFAEKRACMQEELLASGELAFRDETYQIIWDSDNEAIIDGAHVIHLTEWPENVFTSKIVKPSNGTIDYAIDESASGRYTVFFKDITMEQSEAYIEELKNAGYTSVAGTKEDVAIGVMLQKDDVMLSVACSDGGLGIRIIITKPESVAVDVNSSPMANRDYYNLSEQGEIHVAGAIDSNNNFVQSQKLWTNSTEISIKNNSGTDVTVYLFSVEDDRTPILEMTLSNKEVKAFTNLTSRFVYYIRISAVSSAHVSVDISD